jgi:hypothetical protein
LQTIANFVLAHQTIAALLAYYFSSAFLGSLEAPDATSSKLYRFLFTFANTFAANLVRAFATKLPSGAVNTAQNAAIEPPTVTLPVGAVVTKTFISGVEVPQVVPVAPVPPGLDLKTAQAIESNIEAVKEKS